ncbi:MAG: recombinase family protein [Armatimonadetes bacterium]|nr:recombinase family protein [Armatimonadota bacterium]
MKPLPAIPKAVVYIRVSTAHQEEHGTSLTAQLEACLRKAKELGAEVVHVAEEVKSGGLYMTRGELQKALAVIELGEANILILARLDRTGREVEALRDVRRRIAAVGARLVFADGMTFEKGAVGNLLFTQLSAFAEFEREMIRERMVSGLENKARAGIMPSRSKAPYGYRIWQKNDAVKGLCTESEVGRYVLREDEARWIAPLFERYVETGSLRGVCAWLTQSGAKSSSGQPWNPATLSKMIRNPVYKGAPAWRKTKRIVDEARAARGLGIEREVARAEEDRIYLSAPALVTPELWGRAGAVLDGGREERSGRGDRRYLLSGLVRCPRCGSRLYARANPTTRGEKHYANHVYKCARSTKRQAQSQRTCDFPTMGGKLLERFVLEAMEELLARPQIVAAAQREFAALASKKKATADDEGEAKRLRREIEVQRRREDEATNAEIEARLGGNDGGAFARFRLKAEAARRDLEKQLAEIEARLRGASVAGQDILSPDAARVVRAALGDESLSVAARGTVLRLLVQTIYPLAAPDALRVSAHQMREAGQATPEGLSPRAARFCGGCDIVLRTGEGATYILSRQIVKLEASRDANKRAALRPIYATTLRVETASPFPDDQGRHSPLDEEIPF